MSFLRAHWVTKAEDEVSWELHEHEQAKFYVLKKHPLSTRSFCLLLIWNLAYAHRREENWFQGLLGIQFCWTVSLRKMYYFSFLFRINSMPLSTGELWPPRVTPRVWSCKRYTYLVFPQWASAFLKINPFYHPFYHPTHPDSYCWLCSAISFQPTMKFSSAEPLQLNGDSCVSRKWSRWPSFPSPVIARIQCSRQSAQHYERTELLYL